MATPGSPFTRPPSRSSRPPRALLVAIALAIITVVAGCTGGPVHGANTTAMETTAPTTTTKTSPSSTPTSAVSTGIAHTPKGTSHAGTHLTVDAIADELTVDIRLYEGTGASAEPVLHETYKWDYGDGTDLTRAVHELDPAYAEIVVNGTQVWEGMIYEYETYRVSVDETDASVEYSVV